MRRFHYRISSISALAVLIASAFLVTPTSADAARRTPRICKSAEKLAKTLSRKVKILKAIATKIQRAVRTGSKYQKLHKAARNLQGPIVRKYASHFGDSGFLAKWTSHKLRKADVRRIFRKIFTGFKGDWNKLRKGGYKNFNKIKSNGFKLPKKAALPLPHRDTAPCGNVQDQDMGQETPGTCPKYKATKVKAGKASKYATKKFNNLKKYFTKGKLTKINNIRLFLKFFSKTAMKNSIAKTKLAIAEGKRFKTLGRKFRRLKKEIVRLQRRLKGYIKKCDRAKRRRTSIDQTSTQNRKCGGEADTTDISVCWVCTNLGNSLQNINDTMGGSLIGSFEGNFQTSNDWCDTNEAYNTGAESAAAAQNAPGVW